VRAGDGRWSASAEKRFIDALADHGNISRAAQAAGFSTQAIYSRRRRYADFREKWEAAKECGRERIDTLLIEAATGTLDPDAFDVPEGVPKVTIAEAIAILRLHHASEKGLLSGGGRRRREHHPPKVATNDEVRAALAKAIAVYRKRRGAELLAKGWSEHEGRMIPPGWIKGPDPEPTPPGEVPGG
jgi:hypothetical protein